MTEADVLTQLRRRTEAADQKTVAQELGVSQAYLSDLLRGQRTVSRVMATRLGYAMVVTFEALEQGR